MKLFKIILGLFFLFLILFILIFIISIIIFPEWLELENWKEILTILIIASGSLVLITIFLEFILNEFANLTLLPKIIKYYFGFKYKNIENQLNKFSRSQIEKEKKSGKYIPFVFIETADIKEKLRYFSDPHFFIQKILGYAKKKIQGNRAYSLLKRIHFPLEEITFPVPTHKKQLNEYIVCAKNELEKVRNLNNIFVEEGSGILDEYIDKIPREKTHLYEYHRPFLYRSSFEYATKDIHDELKLLTDTSVIITSQAGRGKTNLLCDFTENYLFRKNKLCLYFSGRDFNFMGGDESIEDAIARIVFSLIDYSFEDLLTLIRFNRHYDYLFILIDGINEHENLPLFELALEQFLQRKHQEKIKVILSCRSEYLSERFGKLLDLDGLTKLQIDHPSMEIQLPHQKYLLKRYFEHFLIDLKIDAVAEWIQDLFYKDKLLLRFFCEAHKNEKIITSLQNIYRFEIFYKYFTKKCQEINGLRDCLAEITSNMIKNASFIDISFDQFSNQTKSVLKGLFDESLFFRKDLVEDSKLAFGKKEVINFVYDEFREFLLASDILNSWKEDPVITLSQLEALIGNSNVVAEGLQRYLCAWAIKEEDNILLNHLRKYAMFNNVFIENIFAVPDQHVSANALKILVDIFFESSEFSRKIIYRLISRFDPVFQPILNIEFVIDQISKMNNEQYEDLIHSSLINDYRNIISICQYLIDKVRDGDVTRGSKPNILRFLMCLIVLEDTNWLSNDSGFGKFPIINTINQIFSYYSSEDIRQIANNIITKVKIERIREKITSLVERLVG
jgi:hypothetical protein